MFDKLVNNLKKMDSKETVKNASIILMIVIAIQIIQILSQSGVLETEVIFLILAEIIGLIIALTGSLLPVGKERLVSYVLAGILTFISFQIIPIVIGIFYLYGAYKVKSEMS